MLTKDLLRVSRAGGGYHPQFADADDEPTAARVIGVYQGHVGRTRAALREALTDLEREAADFKLVRGFAHLLEREATFEVEAAIPPERARRAAFEAAEAVGVASEAERARAIERAAGRLGVEPETVEETLLADRDDRAVLVTLDAAPDPGSLVRAYNRALAATALFDATEVRIRSSDPRRLLSAVKRNRLLYEIRRTDAGREVVVTGPTNLFGPTRRYGTRFAALLDALVGCESWSLEARIDDRGTERTLRLDDGDPLATESDLVDPTPSYDSQVEADFAARFEALDLDWTLRREPEPLAAGTRVMIPDFAFDYDHADVRIYFEIVGFWTPEYVEKKLRQFDETDVSLLVAYDEHLGLAGERKTDGDLGEEIEARAHRAIPYRDRVRLKDVRDALRVYEDELVAESVAALPEELRPPEDVIDLSTLATRHGVAEAAVEPKSFPDHERVGRTLVRPAVLEGLADRIEPGWSLERAEEELAAVGIDDASAALSALGYRVAWEGLAGGTIEEK